VAGHSLNRDNSSTIAQRGHAGCRGGKSRKCEWSFIPAGWVWWLWLVSFHPSSGFVSIYYSEIVA
jgi:hypothetical protein